MAAVEKSGVADGAHAEAAAFVSDAVVEGGAFVALDADVAKFDELVVVELALEFLEEFGRETGFAELERGLEGLTEAAKVGFLRAGEGEVVHAGESSE